jgi:hypothetical protein
VENASSWLDVMGGSDGLTVRLRARIDNLTTGEKSWTHKD